MSNTDAPPVERTYGNWRKPRPPGLGRLGLLGTVILLAGLVLLVLLLMFSWVAGAIDAVALGLVLLPLGVRDRHDRTLMQHALARAAWWRTRSSGAHIYRSGVLGLAAHGTCRLPGLAAACTISEPRDAYERPFALIEVPWTGHYTVVLRCNAGGASLVDQDQVDTWVAHWGAWLAGLAQEPDLKAAQVTVESAPDTGTALRTEIEGHLAPDAPALARATLTQIVATYPVGSAQVSIYVALTFGAAPRPGANRRPRAQMAQEISTRLPGLTAGLKMAGAGGAAPMSAREVAEMVRTAYDPQVATLIAQARQASAGTGVAWHDAGPAAAEETRQGYRHDSGYSITWEMSVAPRGEVLSSVLGPLLSPHRDIARKRVSLLYRPHSPAAAAAIVERDRRDARFRLGGNKPSARDVVAVRAAEQAAQEEAAGAGVLRFSLLATATVTSADRLPAAAAAMDALAAPARVQLRRCSAGMQATAFAANLPIGVILPEHARVPSIVRDAV